VCELEERGCMELCSVQTGNSVEVVVQLWAAYLRDLLYTRNRFVNIGINVVLIGPWMCLGVLLAKVLPKRGGLYFDSLVVLEKEMGDQ
jgi:hypothetical protein